MRLPKKEIVFGLCSLGGLVLLGILLFHHQTLLKENKILKETLDEFIVPMIQIDGRHYSIKEGVVTTQSAENISLKKENDVLRIGYYSVLQRFDPLFGLEGTDIESLKNTVSLLSTSTEEFSHFFKPKAANTVNALFYPIQFLETLPQLEDLRREVALTPSDNSVREHSEQVSEMLNEYQKYTEALISLYGDLVKEFGSRDLGNVGGITNNESLLAFAKTLNQEAKKNIVEQELRLACLRRFTSSCTPLSEHFKAFTSTSKEFIATTTEKDLPSQIRTILNFYKERFPDEEGFIRPPITPTIALEKSFCHKDDELVYYYLWWEKLQDGVYGFNAEYLNNLYFYDIEQLTRGDGPSPYLTAVRDVGISYLSQQVSNLYMCPNQAKENAKVATLYTLRSLLSEHPIFQEKGSDKNFRRLAELEKEIITESVLYEHTVAAYINELKILLNDREMSLLDSLSKEEIFYLEKLISIHTQQSARLEELVAEIVATNHGLEEILGSGYTLKFDYFFMSRSYPTLTLLTFNPTVVTGNPSFLTYTNSKEGKRLLTPYWGKLEYTLSPEEVIINMQERREKLKNLKF